LNRKIAFTGLACALVAAGVAFAAAKPNFSGTWVLEHARSHSVPRDMQQTMTVTHDGDKINVETRIMTPQGERIVKDEYVLDGKETEFTPQPGPAEVIGKGKRTAKWLPGDKGFTVAEEFQTKSPEGAVVNNQLTRKWIIWADGSLSIDLYQDGPRGSFETKRIFTKKQ
jgi:hypothetical protein